MNAQPMQARGFHLPRVLMRLPRGVAPVAAAAGGLVLLLGTAMFLTSDWGDEAGFHWGDFTWIIPVVLVPGVVGSIVAAVALSRASRLAPGAVVATVLTLASGVAFWAGMPLIIGTSAMVIGRAARSEAKAAGRTSAAGTTAVVVGAVGIIGIVGLYLTGIVADWNPGLPQS